MVVVRMMLCGLMLTLLVRSCRSRTLAEEEGDPFEGRLLPLELIMAHRNEIALTKDAAEGDRRAGGGGATGAWPARGGRCSPSYFELMEVLDEPQIDEDRAITLARQAVDTENEIKLEQMRLLIRVRNLLTPEQVAVLQTKRAETLAGG